MQYIEYWQVTASFDRTVTHIANFTNREEAEALKNKDIYRSVNRKSMVIFDSVADYDESNNNRIRERAIAKLTPEELEVLGLRG